MLALLASYGWERPSGGGGYQGPVLEGQPISPGDEQGDASGGTVCGAWWWAMVSAKCCHSQLLEIVLSTGNSR